MKSVVRFALIAVLIIGLGLAAYAKDDGLPFCKAELNDEFNQLVTKIEWRKDLFMGDIKGATQPVLISTSLGNNRIMSLWVRENKSPGQAGMFSFVDLSSGRDQYMRFYMSDKFSVGVTCRWDPIVK